MTSTHRHMAIVNPAAGGGRCFIPAYKAIDQLRDAGVLLDIAETVCAGEASAIAREAFDKGHRRFISIGGDGTSFEVLNGLFPISHNTHTKPTLGFVPLGTGNSFLRDFTNAGTQASLAAIINDRSRPCDVICLTHEEGYIHFINLMSMGFVSQVAHTRNHHFSGLGQLGYILAVFLNVLYLRTHLLPMTVDGNPYNVEPCVFVSINNSRFTGGKMMMAPQAHTADGLMDVITAKEMGRFSLLRTFPKIFTGNHVEHPKVDVSRAGKITFDFKDKVDVMIDGELLTLRPQRLEVLSNALNVSV